jgi:hypothetical protein
MQASGDKGSFDDGKATVYTFVRTPLPEVAPLKEVAAVKVDATAFREAQRRSMLQDQEARDEFLATRGVGK